MSRLRWAALFVCACVLWGCGPDKSLQAGLPKGMDFVLTTAHGPLDSRTLRGKVVLLYFGYTHCPDVCPASLAAGGQALKALTPEERQRVQMVMVSVDPERDTPARMQEYTAYFHPEMLGGTATPEEIALLAKSFGAGYVKQPVQADGSYAIDHTASTYVLGPDGKLAQVVGLQAGPEAIVKAIRQLL